MCSIRYNGQYIGNVYNGDGGPIWLDDVACFGRETNFKQCRHAGWGNHNCNHSADVSISCFLNTSTQYAGAELQRY